MSRVTRIVNGSDNVVAVVLYDGADPKDMSGVTRVQIEVDDAAGTVLDSNTITMTWSEAVTFDAETVYPIQFDGADAGLAPGVYRDCRVRLFDSESPNGVVWPEPLTLIVED
jgi:hypothetical protein